MTVIAWPHIGNVASGRSVAGITLIMHSTGSGTLLDDGLFGGMIAGHYRHLEP